jgi:MFS family permease
MLAGATFMLCFGRTITVLIVARILQGLSAAVVWTVAVCIMTDRVGSKGVGVVMGWVTLAKSVAIVIGPLLGGVVYAQAGYYAVYAITFAFIFFDFVFRFLLIEARIAVKWDPSIQPESRSPESGVPGDKGKQGAGASQPSSQPKRHGVLYKLAHRLPPLITLLGNIRLVVALWGCFVQAHLLTSFDAVLPLFVKHTFGWNSRGAGLVFLALVIPSFISPAIGWLSDRHGPRWYAAGGYLLCIPVLILLRLVTHDDLGQKVLLCVLLALLGAFLMLFEIPFWVEIVWVVEQKCKEDPHYDSGGKGAFAQAYGLTNLFFASGVMVGPIWAGFIDQAAGWATMAWSLALLCAVSTIPTVIWTGGLITGRRKAN